MSIELALWLLAGWWLLVQASYVVAWLLEGRLPQEPRKRRETGK
jgi:hypothetical protein